MENGKTITVVPHDGDAYVAYLNDNPRLWGRGDTINAAIGDVVRSHPEHLGLSIKFPGEL
jgi:hypothetical protein